MKSLRLPATGERREADFADLCWALFDDGKPAGRRVVTVADDAPAQVRIRRHLVAPACLHEATV